ncbi:MAG: SLBB domain-containing protein [Candidatus Sumerlaeota bacterium]|nr:SLBB domain-containing protein [Candidatus Sumerlaeota bacterium]
MANDGMIRYERRAGGTPWLRAVVWSGLALLAFFGAPRLTAQVAAPPVPAVAATGGPGVAGAAATPVPTAGPPGAMPAPTVGPPASAPTLAPGPSEAAAALTPGAAEIGAPSGVMPAFQPLQPTPAPFWMTPEELARRLREEKEAEDLQRGFRQTLESQYPAGNAPLSPLDKLELAREREKEIATEEIPFFGYDMFANPPVAITEGPVTEEYVVSPKDELLIETWGEYVRKYPVTVSKDGYIDIDQEEMRLFVNGLTLKSVEEEVKRYFATRHRINFAPDPKVDPSATPDSFVAVRVVKIRDIFLYAGGEVINPGVIAMSQTVATLFNVLVNAGGVKRTGSLRSIIIRHNDNSETRVDLYDFLMTGDTTGLKQSIKDSESVFVDLCQRRVAVRGEVHRPGFYEFRSDETKVDTVGDLIRFAGGVTPGARTSKVRLIRNPLDKPAEIVELNLSDMAMDDSKIPLQDGDTLMVLPSVAPEQVVAIAGSGVYRPGVYQWTPDMRLSDLIEKAEGLRGEADMEVAHLVRTRIDFTKEFAAFSLTGLYTKMPDRREVVFSGKKSDPANFRLEPLDEITVYSRYELTGKERTVTLEGHVKQAGTFQMSENMRLSDLLFAQGGLEDPDFRKATHVERADVVRYDPDKAATRIIPVNLNRVMERQTPDDMLLESQDRIVVYAFESFNPAQSINIQGAVRAPGTYPLSENMTLEDAIVMANGLTEEANQLEAEIARVSPDSVSPDSPAKVLKVQFDPKYADKDAYKPGFLLQSKDSIFIRDIPGYVEPKRVSILGEVVYPGGYVLEKRDERLSDLITRAGGLMDTAYPRGAALTRQNERVVIDLAKAIHEPNSEWNLLLENEDALIMPRDPRTVRVEGAVTTPRVLSWQDGRDADHYIRQCGGFASGADKEGVVIEQPDGRIVSPNRWWLLHRSPESGSVIRVPFEGEEAAGKAPALEQPTGQGFTATASTTVSPTPAAISTPMAYPTPAAAIPTPMAYSAPAAYPTPLLYYPTPTPASNPLPTPEVTRGPGML